MSEAIRPGVGMMSWWMLLLLVAAAICLVYVVRNRRINLRPPRFAVPLLVAMALIVYTAARHTRESTGWVLWFTLLSGVAFLYIWIMRRWVRTGSAGSGPGGCPPVGLLREFLAERLPPREHTRLAEHLEHCTACQRWVEGQTAAHKSWAGVARKLTQETPAGPPVLQRVIEQLKKEPDSEATSDAPVFSADLPLGFLSPPNKEGHLGRLERYEVLEEVGRGGMGVVLKAFDPSLHRVVAIKVLAPQLATSGVARQRFLREAKAAAAVSHDHLVTIHAVDEANGLPYLVMQYIAGPSLQQRIDKEGALEVAEILRIGMQTAEGLAAAHGHGMVHRDVKPANILLEEGVSRVKLTDFGLARAIDDASLTQSGVVAGSPLYMAPEQARGEALDHRADLFSLGSVLYTMCTGRPPFRAANTLAVLRRVCEDPPRPVRETNPEIPDWLAAVVEKLMAKEPADRFQSASEVVEVLGRHLAQLQNGAWVPPPRAASPAADLPTSVTLCPSCGASLHVPERMVGTTVHCGACGKPFRAEGVSEEIRVARPVPSPFGRPRQSLPKALVWALYLILFLFAGGALLGILVLIAYMSVSVSSSPDTRAVLEPEVKVWVEPPAPFWRNALEWFPAGATLFGAADLTALGSFNQNDEWKHAVLRLTLPEQARKKLTSETIDNIRIDGVSLAYYTDPDPEKSQGIVQLEGQVAGGRIINFLHDALPKNLQVEERVTGKSARVSGPELPFAVGLLEDRRLVLARSMNSDYKESHHRKVLERIPSFDFSSDKPRPWVNLLAGNNPPWFRTALGEIPPDACGLFVGQVPTAWRKVLAERLRFRTCPSTFVCYLKREGDGVALSLSFGVESAGAAQTLTDDLEKWRRQGLDGLRAELPPLNDEALAILGKTLETLRWEANPFNRRVDTRVFIPNQTVRALWKSVERASPASDEG
jgi:hypothetical protein